MKDLFAFLLMILGALSVATGSAARFRHQRRHSRHLSMVEGEELGGSGSPQGEDEDEDGNGYEYEGLKGHQGLFSAFNWTKSELAKISMWHATAQHYKAAELVEEKLSQLGPNQPFPREQIRSFLLKFQPPAVVSQLFDHQQIQRIRSLHRLHKVREINEIFYQRLMQMDPLIRQQIVKYFTLPTSC